MPEYYREVFAGEAETKLYREEGGDKKEFTSVLLGSWLGVIDEDDEGWLKVINYDEIGWVREVDTRPKSCLKIFFIDVGQGDACIIEVPGKRMLLDGGPNQNLKNYLSEWKYDWMENSSERIRFDAVFVSHFDHDHFKGLISIIRDSNYEFGTVYHSGIARFEKTRSKRPARCDTMLGETDSHGDRNITRTELLTSFNDIEDARNLLSEGGLMPTFRDFLESVVDAYVDERLDRMRRLTARDECVPRFGPTAAMTIKVLGPVTKNPNGRVTYPWFSDDSHTINGHSLVLRLEYGDRSVLLGGDLNTESQKYLLAQYSNGNPFRVHATKACHHGASEFSIDFLKAVKPFATVISSGDNESYSHPRADALGCAGRYTRGKRPLVFSTELARSYKSPRQIHHGNINLRTDGDQMILAQMYEKKNASDPWDSYCIPT